VLKKDKSSINHPSQTYCNPALQAEVDQRQYAGVSIPWLKITAFVPVLSVTEKAYTVTLHLRLEFTNGPMQKPLYCGSKFISFIVSVEG